MSNWYPRIVNAPSGDEMRDYWPKAEDWYKWVADVTLAFKGGKQRRYVWKYGEAPSKKDFVTHRIKSDAKQKGAAMVYLHRLWEPCSSEEIEYYEKVNRRCRKQNEETAAVK